MSKISFNADNLLNPQFNKEPLRLEDLENKIINADCMDILKQLPDKCVDLVLTDPPYGINEKFKGGNSGKMNFNEVVDKGWDVAPSKEVFDEIFRVSKNQIILGGNFFELPPHRCFIVWDKLMPKDFSLAMAEEAWCSFDRRSVIYRMPTEKADRIHPTQKPLQLIMNCLADFSKKEDLILDCFSGSGTTAIACHRLNRRFICIEKDKEYWEASCKRLEDERKQLSLFGGNA